MAGLLGFVLTLTLAGCTGGTATTTAAGTSAGATTAAGTTAPGATTTPPGTTSAGGTENGFTGNFIVDANYVKTHYQDPNVILVDSRGEETARKGTIEGAVATTWQNFSSVENAKPGDYAWGLILEPAVLAQRLGALGLAKDKEIIFFSVGPNGWGEDGRLLWTLRAAGYKNLKMVDGGLKALTAAGLPAVKSVAKLAPVEVQIDALDRTHVIDTKTLETNYSDYKLVDVRADKEYAGEILYGEAKGGHLPGAIQIRYTDLFNKDEALKSKADLTALFEAAGLKKSDKIVAYCTAGIRSAYMQLVMEMCGFTDSKNHEGSYYTWAANHDVEK